MFELFPSLTRRKLIASLTAIVFAVATSGLPAFAAKPAKPPQAPTVPTTILPINLEGVDMDPVTGELLAFGTIGDQPFTAPVILSTSPNLADPSCPILNLELGPITLDLLGLVVETSAICARITAHPGEGLLGDLLCAVANLLNGLDLQGVLAQLLMLDAGTLNELLAAITDILNEVLNTQTVTGVSSSTVTVASHRPGHGGAAPECDILNLVLGPIDLTLLGLQVELDNCEGGPITLDITAVPGAGNLLGNLLCGLAGLLDQPNADAVSVARAINLIVDAIADLL
jgi:hypothetical protein